MAMTVFACAKTFVSWSGYFAGFVKKVIGIFLASKFGRKKTKKQQRTNMEKMTKKRYRSTVQYKVPVL